MDEYPAAPPQSPDQRRDPSGGAQGRRRTGGKSRTGHARKVLADERAVLAYEMRVKESLSFAAVGQRLGITPKAAQYAFRRGRLMCIPDTEVAEAKAEALEKLQHWESMVMDIFLADHPLVNFGKVVFRELPDGSKVPMTDLQPKLAAMDRLLRIAKQREEIVGYAAPNKRVLEIITEDALDRAIAEFNEQAEQLEREAARRTVIDAGSVDVRPALPEST